MNTRRSKKDSPVAEFYKQIKQFQIDNGYLIRMLDDGINVILDDELKSKLYMTAADSANLFSDPSDNNDLDAIKAADPTYGMTQAQKERYLKKKSAKPRPRDIFNVHEVLK